LCQRFTTPHVTRFDMGSRSGMIAGMIAIAVAGSATAQAPAARTPSSSGQAAFATISEVVRILEADPTTDWSRTNFEALRQHLIDMDDVTMHALAQQRNVPAGVELDVSGTGRTVGAIKRMLTQHAAMLDGDPSYRASSSELSNGVKLTVTARNPADANTIARIRGLGFAGLITEGNHHAAHHLALARGDAHPHAHMP
jgi:hypothetical protein